MLKLELIALELLEYKLLDLSREKEIRGGVAGIWDIYHFLDQQQLVFSETERARFQFAEKELKRLTSTPKEARSAIDTFDALVLDSFDIAPQRAKTSVIRQATTQNDVTQPVNTELAATELAGLELDFGSSFDLGIESVNLKDTPPLLSSHPEFEKEQATLQALANKVWWHDIEEVIQQLAVRCRVEKDRNMARLLYAISRNIARYTEDHSAKIEQLEQFKVLIPVTDFDDPLVSFSNLESMTDLVRDIVTIIMSLGVKGTLYADVKLSTLNTLDFIKQVAFAVARDPYAGQHSALAATGPSSEQIRIAIQENAKELIREDLKKEQQYKLEQRLVATLEQEKRIKELFDQDVRHFLQSAKTFFDRLEPYIPKRLGGLANDPSLPHGVLFAEMPALAIKTVPAEASSLSLRLTKPIRFRLMGHIIGISVVAKDAVLMINKEERPLKDYLKLELNQHYLYAFKHEDYIHLKILDESRSLASRLAETMAVLFVLSSSHSEFLLRVIQTAAGVSMGGSQVIVESAISRLRELSSKAPSRRKALEGLLKGSAKALGISLEDNVLMSLVQRLITAMTVSPEDLSVVLESTDSTEAFVYQLADDPISLTIARQPTTLRKYRSKIGTITESVVVMTPGRIIGSFSRTLLQAFPGGTLMCARAKDEVAILYFENLHIPNL